MLDIADLDADTVAAFLDHLQTERGNSARTRNARLAAIHSLYRYAALRHPEHAQDIQRVLSIPPKRTDRALVTFLDQHEIDALLAAPDRTTWTGRRDHALLLLAIQTGLRASELTTLNVADVQLAGGRTRHLRRERAASRGSPRSPRRPARCCASGSPSAPAIPTTRCSQRSAADDSAATRSNDASPLHVAHAAITTSPRSSRRTSRCTRSGTPPRCSSCTPGSTPPSSPCG